MNLYEGDGVVVGGGGGGVLNHHHHRYCDYSSRSIYYLKKKLCFVWYTVKCILIRDWTLKSLFL